MTKTIAAALIAAAFALPASYALATPPSGHGMDHDHTSMNRDAHGDAVSAAAHDAKADDANVGKSVSPVANDKNHGKHEAKGHGKSHHHH